MLDDVLTVMWTDVAEYAAQTTYVEMPARVLNPTTQAEVHGASLRVTVDAPEPFLLPSQVGAWSEAVAMPFVLDDDGDLVGSWPLPDPLVSGADVSTTWYLNVGEGSPLGLYEVGVEVLDATGVPLSTDLTDLTLAPPSEHGGGGGGGGGGSGELPPVATLESVPSIISGTADATFTFSATGAAGFSCSLDGAAMTACTSPMTYTGLADGAHTFAVRATAGAGRVGPTVVHTWSIDTVPPEVSIVSMVETGRSGKITIEFVSEGFPTTCALDGAALVPCTSPVQINQVGVGSHTFVVQAVDAAGNVGSDTRAWTKGKPSRGGPRMR